MDFSQVAQALAPSLESYFPSFGVDNVGSWTATFSGLTTSGSYTYGVQAGYFSRVGNIVFISFYVGITAITVAPTGPIVIAGLPFISKNTANGFIGIPFSFVSNLPMLATSFTVSGLINPNSNLIRLIESPKNGFPTDYPAANFTNPSCQIIGTGCYHVD